MPINYMPYRLSLAEMPEGPSGQVLTGQGAGVNPVYAAVPPAPAEPYYPYGGIFIDEAFESLDGWLQATTGSGGISLPGYGYATLSTGTTANSVAYLRRELDQTLNAATWDKKRKFKARLFISSLPTGADDHVWVVSGERDVYQHIGFKIVAGTLYATVGNGTAESTLSIQAVAAGDSLLLEAVLTPGVGCEFFVNGVSKGTLTTNLPTGTTYADWMVGLEAHNASTASDLNIRVGEYMLLQEE